MTTYLGYLRPGGAGFHHEYRAHLVDPQGTGEGGKADATGLSGDIPALVVEHASLP
jgi:hypothetical protein